MARPLVEIRHADVTLQGTRVLSDISWLLRPGEDWAVLGPNGSGKSTFLKLVLGDLWPDRGGRGRRVYHFGGESSESPIGIRERIAFVSPERQNAYVRNNWDLTGEEVVHTGFFDSVWLQERPKDDELETAERFIALLKIGDLRRKSILAMSEGEARKVLIARALVGGPVLIIFDEVCSGLDGPSRMTLLGIIEKVIRTGTQVLYATHQTGELPPSMSHVMAMDQGRVVRQGRREVEAGAREIGSDSCKRSAAHSPLKAATGRSSTSPMRVEVRNSDVYLDRKQILHRVGWRMKANENWAVLGRNGSGKTTFLKLIAGEVRPALGGEVRWFGSKSRRNIWEIRRRLGAVSPDLQARYDDPLTVEDAVCSGFFSSIGLYRSVTAAQRRNAVAVLHSFGLERLREKDIGTLSYGEMRKVLIARALVKETDLLILDEPCSGLDPAAREDVLRMIETIGRGQTGLVLVTHHLEDLVPSITHLLLMDGGRLVAQGRKAAVLNDRRVMELLGREEFHKQSGGLATSKI